MKQRVRQNGTPPKNLKKREWVKLGGLGADIGGEEWMLRKKKEEKRNVIVRVFRNFRLSSRI
jgi:hypothetical protein